MVVVELLNQVHTALSNYFKALSQFGYKKDSDVEKLLVFIGIEELVTGDMRQFITEEDYRAIEKALYCLYGTSCLLPYPTFSSLDSMWGTGDTRSISRFTEDNNVRVSEADVIRHRASNSYN